NSHRSDVAVFIDFENVYVSTRDKLDANPNFEMIMDRCEDLGRVVIARAYADWYRYPRVTSALYANGIEPMYVPTYYYDRDLGRTGRAIKNSVDMNLCIDAMKTLFTNPNIEKFVLATGDRDFIPLVNSIRQQGKEVIVIGIGGAASSHLAQSADEFIFYETLVGKKPDTLRQDQPKARMPEKGREYEAEERSQPPVQAAREPAAPSQSEDIFDVLVRAIHLARERDFVCSFGSLKLLMKELMGGEFREDRYRDANGRPFAKFKDFVMEAERRGKVNVFTSGAMNEVFLPGEDPYKLSRFAMDLKEEQSVEETPPASQEEHSESARQSVGRRRRRRSRSGRSQSANGVDTANTDEVLDGDEEAELPEAEETSEVYELDELEGVPPIDDSDDRFEELLGRLGLEHHRRAALDADVEEVANELAETADVAPEPEQPGAETAETPSVPEVAEEPSVPEAAEPVSSTPAVFSEQEWATFGELLSHLERPLSFLQLHDLLRNARKNNGINRTNEELRTMIKQAINTGLLSRSGKGSKVVYRYAPAEAATAELVVQTPGGETALEEPAIVTPAPVEDVPAATAETVEIPVTAEQPAVATETKPARRKTTRRKKAEAEAPVAEAAPEPVAPEAEEARPKTRRRRATKKAEPTEEAS
ncbi:MAG TPA: NYN domain-containing protein, partial [Roseiflexaceae bacterium]|nr:NYN domain-containing protein [Roseiflexaceae bacterium]